MKTVSRLARLVFSVIAVAVVVAMLLLPRLNGIQQNGVAPLGKLDQPVSVVRDENGMAYIRANSLLDAIRAQGYVTAQDRLFQLQLTRIAVSGRLAEYFGDKLVDRDKRQRTLGFYRAAEKHVSLLDESTRSLLQAYADGVNAFIQNPRASIPLELRIAGIQPQLWRVIDSLAVMYFMGWGSAADLDSELLTQAIIAKVGAARFSEMAPLNIFPHDQQSASVSTPYVEPRPINLLSFSVDDGSAQDNALQTNALQATALQSRLLHASADAVPSELIMSTLEQFGCCDANHLALGSNNWAIGAERSPGGKPIVVNDPHLESTLLPTTFYPIGLFTPDLRAVGVNVPGLPGIIIGRNQFVAAGATNAYADAQDVYIESVDTDNPMHYLEGEASIPFEVIESDLKIKDDSSESGYRIEQFDIRLTRRGPIISDLNGTAPPDDSNKILSVRWSPYETMSAKLGLDFLLRATSVADVRRLLADATAVHLNFVFADTQGKMGWQVTGRIPTRRNNHGGRPVKVVDAQDNWTGWVPYRQMPSSYDHPQGWVGTANHRTVPDSTAYFYSSYFAPDYRIRRMQELFGGDAIVDTQQHWQAMRDDLNLLARDIVPVMVEALRQQPETEVISEILASWDYHDSADASAPLIFQEIWRRMVEQTFADEWGQELAIRVTKTAYYWSQRMHRWILDGESVWFDNTETNRVESLDDIILAAALDAMQSIEKQLGADAGSWKWGDLHRINILNPLRRTGIGKRVLGGGSHAMGGSAQTLYRASFDLSEPGNQVVHSAALRMMVDLSDDEKVTAVLPGGVSGRLFTKHFVDQVDEYMDGEKIYWWFSDAQIDQHAQSLLTLSP